MAEEPVDLPSAPSFHLKSNIIVQPPLSKRGAGPCLFILVDEDLPLDGSDKTLDPPPLKKWAEEGYTVAQISISTTCEEDAFYDDVERAYFALTKSLWKDPMATLMGCISYCRSPPLFVGMVMLPWNLVAAVSHGEPLQIRELQGDKRMPHLIHVAGDGVPTVLDSRDAKVHNYLGAKQHFTIPSHENYHPSHAAVAHTRTLAFLKPHMRGPYFDLEAIWDEHAKFEFGERSVAKTMGTMVDEPYVNHIPTITGGVGRDKLTHFYGHHFIHNNPPDAALELVSRTVGIDRVIDEFVFACTHTKEIDWLIPGIPPTGKPLKIPFTSVVNIRGDRLFHEHISWDQATVLVQLGLMPEYLDFPYPVNGKDPAPGKKFVYKVPAAGADTARKLVDENAVESNQMFGFGIMEVDA